MIKYKGKKQIYRGVIIFAFLLLFQFGIVMNVWGESMTEEETDVVSVQIENEEEMNDEANEETGGETEDSMFKLQFVDSDGSVILEEDVPVGEEYIFPALEDVEGYRNLGWAVEKDAAEVVYLAEESYLIESDLTLYPVRERVYKVTFLSNTGKTTARLQALTITGVLGETVQLPKLPVYSGYTSFGWTTQLKGKEVTHLEESDYVIEEDITFYQINGHTVTFYNNKGTSQYKEFKTTTVGNSYITLPKLPKKTGYKALGWTTKKGASTARFTEGSKVWIKRTVPLYAVYKKVPVYTVKFYTYAGAYEYKEYRMKVNSGTKITLPQLPRKLNYQNVGWGTVKRASASQVKKAGTKVTVNSNLNFYIYRKEAKTIQFMYNNGKGEYMSLRMDVTGDTAILPSMKSPKGYVFLGWSDTPNKSSYPNYQMGQKITMTKGMKLYSVLMKTPIASISTDKIHASNSYDTVFFIGDSRTMHLKSTISEVLGESADKVQYFYKSGQGIAWLEENEAAILEKIKNTEGKKAVVFNLGVNNIFKSTDLKAMSQRYADLMESMSMELKKSNCTFYFMSINPVNDKEAMTESYKRFPEKVKYFNYLLKNKLNGFTYIDTYNYLIKTGFELKDGLHYTDPTYQKIFNKAISVIDSTI